MGSIRRPGRPENAIWHLTLLLLTLGLVYFGSGYCKLTAGGLAWVNGFTLQAYLYGDYLLSGAPQTLWLAQNYWLCLALSIVVIVLEMSFVVGCLVDRLWVIYAIGGLFLHLGIFYFMDINFLQYPI